MPQWPSVWPGSLAYSSTRPPSDVLKNFIATLQRQRPKASRAKSAGKSKRWTS